MNKTRMSKIGRILSNVLIYLFLALCLFVVFLTVFSKRDSDGAAEVFGYQMRVVTSDSMAKCEHTDVSEYEIKHIPIRSMVFVRLMPTEPAEAEEWYRSLRVGDVLTFRYVYTTQVTITHRITSITEKPTGGFVIELAGDNKNADGAQLYQVIDTSVPNSTNYVLGKVTGSAYLLGVLVSFLMQPIGLVLVVILPCLIIILLEAIKIAKLLTSDKKQRERIERESKDRELEELRRRLEELEKGVGAEAEPSAEAPPAPENQTTEKEE